MLRVVMTLLPVVHTCKRQKVKSIYKSKAPKLKFEKVYRSSSDKDIF